MVGLIVASWTLLQWRLPGTTPSRVCWPSEHPRSWSASPPLLHSSNGVFSCYGWGCDSPLHTLSAGPESDTRSAGTSSHPEAPLPSPSCPPSSSTEREPVCVVLLLLWRARRSATPLDGALLLLRGPDDFSYISSIIFIFYV